MRSEITTGIGWVVIGLIVLFVVMDLVTDVASRWVIEVFTG